MKNVKLRRRAEAEKPKSMLRLVSLDTPNGTFIRFHYVDVNLADEVFAIENMPLVYDTPEEAVRTVQQMMAALELPMLYLDKKFTILH